MKLFRLCIAGGLGMLMTTCSIAHYPIPVCLVAPEDSGVVFSFRPHQGIVLSFQLLTRPQPCSANELEVWRNSGDRPGPIWSVEQESGDPASSVRYGQVPDGWRQITPSEGGPETLY